MISMGFLIGWQRFWPHGAWAGGVGALIVVLIARRAGGCVVNLINQFSRHADPSALGGNHAGITEINMRPRTNREFELLHEQSWDVHVARATRRIVYGAAAVGAMIELPVRPSIDAITDVYADGKLSIGVTVWFIDAVFVVGLAWILATVGAKMSARVMPVDCT